MALEGQLESEQASMTRLVQEQDAKAAEFNTKLAFMQVMRGASRIRMQGSRVQHKARIHAGNEEGQQPMHLYFLATK